MELLMDASLTLSQVPFKNVSYDLQSTESGYDGSCWFGIKPELKAKNPLVNLPHLVDGDVIVSQSTACLVYLGKKLNLYGASASEEVMCLQTICEVFDLRNKMTGLCYSGLADPKEAGAKLIAEVSGANSSLAKLQLVLETNKAGKGTFLVGSNATPADFHLFEMCDQYTALATWVGQPQWLETTFPGIKAFHEKFKSLPANSAYFASDLYKLPFNQKSAVFGSHPVIGEKYQHGPNPPEWHGSTKDYALTYIA